MVGPRPIVAAEVEKYGEHFGVYCRVKPGVTGLWQVSGRSKLTYEERVDLDCDYVRRWSLLRDLRNSARDLQIRRQPRRSILKMCGLRSFITGLSPEAEVSASPNASPRSSPSAEIFTLVATHEGLPPGLRSPQAPRLIPAAAFRLPPATIAT